MKAVFRIGVSALAVMSIAGLCGQSAYAADAPAPAASDQAPATQEIVVTAERRATNLQRTAVAATVLTADDLHQKSITSADQLQFASPSLTVNNAGQGNNFNIRGIGEATRGSAFSVGVVTYRDGIATFPGYFQDEPYYDIGSVEVLRGPQGTFAGGNATGGAIFITEANPTTDRVKGYVTAQYGNYNDAKIEGAVNIPLSDTLAIRIATDDERRDTFYHITGPWTGNPGNLRSYNGRVSLLWTPTPQIKVLIKGDYSSVNSGGYPGNPAVGSTNDIFDITSNAHLEGKDETGRISANISYTTDGGVVFRSLTGYQKGTTQASLDADGTSNPIVSPLIPVISSTLSDYIHERVWSEEFNIVSPDRNPLTWVVGGYYQNDLITIPQGNGYVSTTTEQYLGQTLSLVDTLNGTNPKTALAAFGQVGYKFTDALQLQVGARWSRTTASNDANFVYPPYGTVTQNDHDANDSLTGKIAINWTVDPHNFLYAFVATGAKAGGVNAVNLIAPPTNFNQERVTDYEIGWKGTLLDGHLHTQIGGYYNHYTNFQVTVANPAETEFATILNVPTASALYGAEFSAQGRFSAFSFDIAAAYEHTKLGTFYAYDTRAGASLSSCSISTGPAVGYCENLTGTQQPYAPKFTFNTGAQYDFALGDGVTLTPRVDYSHTGAVWATIFENVALGDRINARDLVNTQLTLAKGPWTLTGYATNLTNQHYVAAVDQLTVALRRAGPPRQYGVRVSRSF